jgi:Protein of unknown function (DUF3106)
VEKFMTGLGATVVLCVAAVVASLSPCLAQSSYYHPAQAQAQPHPPAQAPSRSPATGEPFRPGHAGDWLRRYQNLPPAERERALMNDPGFRRLPPERQQMLRQRLEHFSSLPPEQQQRVINRMEIWEHLTPGQKADARDLYGRLRQLPPDRQRMVKTAVRDLSTMPYDQRMRVIDSPRFKGMFSPEEREIMRGAAKLPFTPPPDQPPQ